MFMCLGVKTTYMKLTTFLFGLLFIISSCNKHSEKSIYQDYQGRWNLTKMSGNTANSETTGSDMEWQESYVFNSNGTFLKSREQNGNLTESSGSFTVTKSEEGNILELTHVSDSNIIGSCLGNKKEVLVLQSKVVLSSTWNQCDGPGLEYEKAMNID
ncbi:MAG: hypothetical protein ACI815_001806 [Psychroserpens sp.]|jgi:hypothetical protein